jgi:hypothetical protein
MTDLPGEPLPSGMRWLTDDEQEEFRKQHKAMMKRLQPRLDEMYRRRRLDAAKARNAVIG